MRITLFCFVAERTKHTHAQGAFRFLAERHKTLANGNLAEGLVGETTGHQCYCLSKSSCGKEKLQKLESNELSLFPFRPRGQMVLMKQGSYQVKSVKKG